MTLAGGWPMPIKSCWTACGARELRTESQHHSVIPGHKFWIEKRIWGRWTTFEA